MLFVERNWCDDKVIFQFYALIYDYFRRKLYSYFDFGFTWFQQSLELKQHMCLTFMWTIGMKSTFSSARLHIAIRAYYSYLQNPLMIWVSVEFAVSSFKLDFIILICMLIGRICLKSCIKSLFGVKHLGSTNPCSYKVAKTMDVPVSDQIIL